MAKRPMFLFVGVVGLIVGQAMFDNAVAQTACSPNYIISLFDHISPFLVGALGAFLTYLFTSYHERIKTTKDRRQRQKELAIALSTELDAVRDVISNRTEQLDRLDQENQNGGHSIEKSRASQIYEANLSVLGLLGGDALKSTIVAYKFIAVIPKTVRVRRGLQGIHAKTFDELLVAPQSGELRSIIENHENVVQSISVAIRNLKRLITKTEIRPEPIPDAQTAGNAIAVTQS